MENDSTKHLPANHDSRWPAGWILLYGSFGARTPEERRFFVRSNVALFAMAVCMLSSVFLHRFIPKGIARTVFAIAPGATFTYIAWEFRRYLSALDELARRMQLEAAAWTYLCALPAAMLLGGLGFVYHWHINWYWFLALEPMRAIWLYILSRRYQ
jgi:hypothetical protein